MRLRPHNIKSRRALAIGVAAGLVTVALPPMAAHAAADCSITATWSSSDPVNVASADELSCIGGPGTLDLNYVMTDDIDLSGTAWLPIGSSGAPFTGTFDGGGFTVEGLDVNQSGVTDVGLFGGISGATISDLTLLTANVVGGGHVGGLVGNASGSVIENVTATNVSVEADGAQGRVGGLIGYMVNTTLTDASVTGTVTATHDDSTEAGGVVGRIDASPADETQYEGPLTTITNAEFTGDVRGPDSVGGILGGGDTAPRNGPKWMALTNLRSAGTVSSTVLFDPLDWNWAVGGAIGAIFDTDLREIHSTATVSSTSTESGGLIGSLADSTLRSASAEGDVTVTITGRWCGAGGLIGSANRWWDDGEPLIVEDVSSTGDVVCDEGESVGGLVGYIDNANFSRATSTGAVTTTSASMFHIGGFAGSAWDSHFTDVSAEGSVTTEGYSVGGLIGGAYRSVVGDGDAWTQPRDVIITRASTSGSVTGGINVGGIVGTGVVYDTTGGIQILTSSSSSSVTGVQSVGGIAGGGGGEYGDSGHEFLPAAGDFVLRDVVSTGAITGWLSADDGSAPTEANYGGLVGYLSETGSIERAYTTSTLNTDVARTNSTIGSMIGVSNGTLTGLSFTSVDESTLPFIGSGTTDTENAQYRSLSDLGKLSTYSTWNSTSTVIVDEWVPASSRTTRVWGTCATVASGLPFLQWQRTEACPAAPAPPSPAPDNEGTGGNSPSDSGSSQSPTASGSQASGNDSPVTQTGALPLFRQPTAPQQVTGTVTLVPTSVAAATPTRAMRQEASATLGSAPTVMATANQPVKLLVPGFTPGGTYTVQVKSNNGYVVLGSVEADANGQLQMPVFRMTNGASTSTTTIAIVSATGEASYVKVKTTKKRGAGEKNRTRGAAAGNRR